MSASILSDTSQADVLDTLRSWSDAGLLRHLDSAFAAFVAELDPSAAPALLVSAAVLTQMEGRGHSCLPLASLVATPQAVLAWQHFRRTFLLEHMALLHEGGEAARDGARLVEGALG